MFILLSVQRFCECVRPVCSDCELPVKVQVDSRSAMRTIKDELLNSGDLETFSDDQLERAINYTTDTFKNLTDTKEALERKDAKNIILLCFFGEVEVDPEPMRFFIQFLKLWEENLHGSHKFERYCRMLGDDEDDDEHLTPCVQCSSPPKSPSEEVSFPPIQYVHGGYPLGFEIRPVEVCDESPDTI